MVLRCTRLRLVVSIALATLVGFAVPAGAQSEDRVAANLEDSGVFVEAGADGTVEGFTEVIARLAAVDLDLHIASLAEDDPNIEAFARALRDKTGGTVLVITPGQLAGASDTYNDTQVGRAIDASIDDFGDVEQGALSFGEALVGARAPLTVGSTAAQATDPPATTPATTSAPDATDATGGGGGGGGGFWIFLLVVAALIVAGVLFVRSRNKKRVAGELTRRRDEVGEELEAIGVEIVDLADRVTVEDDEAATTHFRQANEQFLDLRDRLEAATSLWEVTEIDHDADIAAWHLDAAVAVLDGQPIPAEPERPAPPVAGPVVGGGGAGDPDDDPGSNDPSDRSRRAAERERVPSRLDRRRSAEPSPRQRSRQRRREDWQPPRVTGGRRGGGLGGVLGSVLVGSVLGGGGRTRPPRRWNGSGTVSDPPRPRRTARAAPSPRTRSGGSASRRRTSSGGGASSATRSRGGSASRDR